VRVSVRKITDLTGVQMHCRERSECHRRFKEMGQSRKKRKFSRVGQFVREVIIPLTLPNSPPRTEQAPEEGSQEADSVLRKRRKEGQRRKEGGAWGGVKEGEIVVQSSLNLLTSSIPMWVIGGKDLEI